MLTDQAYRSLQLGQGGSYGITRDALKHSIWDTWYFGSTVSDHTFFSTGIGQPWRNSGTKTLNETNMPNSGTFPNGQTFLATHLSVALMPLITASTTNGCDIVSAFYNILQNSIFEIRIEGRPFDYQVHGSMFLPRPVAMCAETATNNPTIPGFSTSSGIVPLDPAPIFIDQLVSFNVHHTITNGDSAVLTQLNTDSTLLNGLYATYQVALLGFFTRAK
jgi:hypothetical protein